MPLAWSFYYTNPLHTSYSLLKLNTLLFFMHPFHSCFLHVGRLFPLSLQFMVTSPIISHGGPKGTFCINTSSHLEVILLPKPTLSTLESVLYIFLRKYNDSCLVLLFLQVLWNKNCKKIKYLKCSNKMVFFVVILIYCVPIVNMKHSYFASQGHNLYCCYI